MLKERMALAKELWAAGVRALFLQAVSPSLKDHYEYANAHKISWFALLEKSTFAAADLVKVSFCNSFYEQVVLWCISRRRVYDMRVSSSG